MKKTFLEAVRDVFITPKTWTRLGAVITGAGISMAPDWWQYVLVFGGVICPLIGDFMEEVQKRMGDTNAA